MEKHEKIILMKWRRKYYQIKILLFLFYTSKPNDDIFSKNPEVILQNKKRNNKLNQCYLFSNIRLLKIKKYNKIFKSSLL